MIPELRLEGGGDGKMGKSIPGIENSMGKGLEAEEKICDGGSGRKGGQGNK